MRGREKEGGGLFVWEKRESIGGLSIYHMHDTREAKVWRYVER